MRLQEKQARLLFLGKVLVMGIFLFSSCGKPPQPGESGGIKKIEIDGSSTVFPISEAVAEEFQKENTNVKVTVGISGTGGGFKKFCAGEIDISDASRPIKKEEMEKCAQKGIDYIELPVAFDGLSVLVHPENSWVDYFTVEELKKVWEPKSKVQKWSDIRKSWPDEKINLYGPGADSGTFDYFTEAIVGEEGASRADYTASEDDNVLVQGVSNDKNALGYFGYGYYTENKEKLKLVPIDGGKGPVLPSEKTIREGTYQPLSRPLFIYVNAKAAEKEEVAGFVKFYLKEASRLVSEVGYLPLSEKAYQLALKRFEAKKTGSVFSGRSHIGITLEEVLKQK